MLNKNHKMVCDLSGLELCKFFVKNITAKFKFVFKIKIGTRNSTQFWKSHAVFFVKKIPTRFLIANQHRTCKCT